MSERILKIELIIIQICIMILCVIVASLNIDLKEQKELNEQLKIDYETLKINYDDLEIDLKQDLLKCELYK